MSKTPWTFLTRFEDRSWTQTWPLCCLVSQQWREWNGCYMTTTCATNVNQDWLRQPGADHDSLHREGESLSKGARHQVKRLMNGSAPLPTDWCLPTGGIALTQNRHGGLQHYKAYSNIDRWHNRSLAVQCVEWRALNSFRGTTLSHWFIYVDDT